MPPGNTGQYQNNRVECDHGRLKARLRPMRGLKTHRTASVVIRGHAFIQNLRRGHYELAVDTDPPFRLATAFDELQTRRLTSTGAQVPPRHGLSSNNATEPPNPAAAFLRACVAAGLNVVVSGGTQAGRPTQRQRGRGRKLNPDAPSEATSDRHPGAASSG